jgi:adenylate cyclase
VIPVAAPIGAFSLGCFAMILRSYFTEGRRRHAIKRAFGQYLSPAVVSEIARDPDNVRMGGEEQEVSVFFSDIADFTSISERMQPTELVAELCRYLTHATKIITDRHGTLDKYIGDAVMAFWGAPLPMADHASRAVLASLDVQRALAEFPQFATRIGIHTGRCVVGNIGSDLRFNYTAIGDTVNLASRLEGLNKQFGTRIIVSETTYAKARSAIEARCLGRVRVKGRAEPIAIYQPLSLKGELSPEEMAALDRFDEALDRFQHADFTAAHSLFGGLASDDDSVVAYYAGLCERFAHEPPEDFDGVIVFKEK